MACSESYQVYASFNSVKGLTLRSDDDMDQTLFGDPGGHFQIPATAFGQNYGVLNGSSGYGWQMPHHGHGKFSQSLQFGASSGPQSAQSNIVSNRGDHVNEHFGQITPPDDRMGESSPAKSLKRPSPSQQEQEEDIAKMNRTQRARNAANKRHSKSKTARRGSGQDNDETGEGDMDHSKSTNQQREKNRVAAAKCRAKKKANSEEMQDSHREGAKENNYLHREVRELRDQKAFLRNTLLQHEPGVCQCHAIHNFNMAQAQQLAFGVGAMIRQPLSPSQESVGSDPTQSSEASRRMSVSSRPQSDIGSTRYTFGSITSPGSTLPNVDASTTSPRMPQQFAEFLHSSPKGRGGFS